MKKDIHEALRNPSQVYRQPSAVLQDDSLSREQKIQVLESWKQEAVRLQSSEAEGMVGGERSHLDQVTEAIDSLKGS